MVSSPSLWHPCQSHPLTALWRMPSIYTASACRVLHKAHSIQIQHTMQFPGVRPRLGGILSPPWCLQGGSLRDLLDYQQRHPMERVYDYIDVLQWLLEVARGLRYLHSRSLMHRSGSDLGRILPGRWHKFVCSRILYCSNNPEQFVPYLLSMSFIGTGDSQTCCWPAQSAAAAQQGAWMIWLNMTQSCSSVAHTLTRRMVTCLLVCPGVQRLPSDVSPDGILMHAAWTGHMGGKSARSSCCCQCGFASAQAFYLTVQVASQTLSSLPYLGCLHATPAHLRWDASAPCLGLQRFLLPFLGSASCVTELHSW